MRSPTPFVVVRLLCLLVAGLATTAAVANAPQNNQKQCPKVEVKGPTKQKGLKPIKYSVKIKNFPQTQKPFIKWVITGGEITKGQGTTSIKVEPNARLVKAVVVIENAPTGCELTATASTEITGPLPNKPPQVGVAASPSAILKPCPPNTRAGSCTATGGTVALTATASDPENDQLLYTWSVTGGRLTGEGRSVVWDLSGVANATYTATVEVNDGNGHVANASTTVTVADCTDCERIPPPCPSLSVSVPSEVKSGEPVTFTATGSDEATYNWSVSAGTITSGQGTSTIVVDTSGLAGQSVTATVSLGGLDPSCSATASATVTIASAPQLTLISGIVKDANGASLVGAQVSAVREGGDFSPPSTITGTDGRYNLRSLPTGKYSVTVTFPGHKPSTQSINLKDPGDEGILNFTLQKNR
jgi:hypothetical protein